MRIRPISLEETLLVRSLSLRNGKALELCTIAEDLIAESFHVGAEISGKILATASFYPIAESEQGGWQLRMMGVHPEWQGRGVGEQVLGEGMRYLGEKQVPYLWCNARIKALSFYQRLGFEIISEAFEIPEIGTHYRMRKYL